VKYVLFVCTHNAGRSHMAQAFFSRDCAHDCRAESAGSDPADRVWPEVVEVMREVGVDLSGQKPKRLSVEMQLHADWAVTMGCGDVCPYVPTRVDARDIPDPAGRWTRSARSAISSPSGSPTCWTTTSRTSSPRPRPLLHPSARLAVGRAPGRRAGMDQAGRHDATCDHCLGLDAGRGPHRREALSHGSRETVRRRLVLTAEQAAPLLREHKPGRRRRRQLSRWLGCRRLFRVR
jgi:arsenate reductase (thioredoxin)